MDAGESMGILVICKHCVHRFLSNIVHGTDRYTFIKLRYLCVLTKKKNVSTLRRVVDLS